MSSSIGNNYKITIFGQSHGKSIGVVIDGIKPGLKLDFDFINKEMNRRRPGKNKISTSRTELDKVDIQSGYFNDKTTGSPLCGIIKNTDTKSRDYDKIKNLLRPGHADYTSKIKYFGFNDYRGGGQFSGRLTAPICFAGAIAKQILKVKNIYIGSHIKSIKDIQDDDFNNVENEEKLLNELTNSEFPLINNDYKEKMINAIEKAKENGDSIGGTIEVKIINVPAGLGEPFFNSYESNLSHLLFSIPAIKGVEFGKGFDITKMNGSDANDEFYYEDKNIRTYTNNSGGILGGISNGMPINFKVAVKPTPSISRKQKTVDIETNKNTSIEIDGRHDPCIVPRVLVVVEAVAAIVTLDLLLERNKYYE